MTKMTDLLKVIQSSPTLTAAEASVVSRELGEWSDLQVYPGSITALPSADLSGISPAREGSSARAMSLRRSS